MLKKLPRKAIWIFLVVVLIAGGTAVYFNRTTESSDEEDTPSMQTAVVRKGDIEVIASGSGTLIAEGSVSLGFGTSGEIAELFVQPGDVVTAGKILAVQADIENLETEVYAAQITLLGAENDLEDVIAGADVVTAEAQLALAQAQDVLSDAEYAWSVNQEGNRASYATLLAAEANLTLAEIKLDNAKADYDSVSGSKSEKTKANAAVAYANALASYESQLAAWNWYNGHPSEIEQAMLDGEVALAEANLAEAERYYESVQDCPEEMTLELARLQVAKAQTDLSSALANLEAATIKAPFDGTILSVSAAVGDTVNSDFIVMDDLTVPYLEVFIDETDLFLIDLDYTVEVIFDVLPDDVFTGTVVQVDPELYASGNSSMVHAKVEMDPDERVSGLPIGVTAGVDVIAGRAKNVVLVPVESLRDLGGGEYAVFVVENGEPKMRVVEVGLVGISFAEITSGLKVGETISTGIVETQ